MSRGLVIEVRLGRSVWVMVDPWLMWHALFVGVQRYVTGKRLLVFSADTR